GTSGTNSYAQKTKKPAKKIICYNFRGEGYVARQCKEPKRAKDTQYFNDMVMLSEARDRDEQGTSSSQPQEVHNSGYDLKENVVSYDAYLAEADLINETPIIPPVEEVVAPLPDQHSESLTGLQFNERFAMLYGKLEDCQQANLDLIETKDSFTSQLESCKLELKNLEWNKVKLESDQLFVQRANENRELGEDNSRLTTTIIQQNESIEILKDKITNLVSEKDKIISDKKACKEKYLEET
nr:hypothetical protein [Tanacetum cinerariifolium]